MQDDHDLSEGASGAGSLLSAGPSAAELGFRVVGRDESPGPIQTTASPTDDKLPGLRAPHCLSVLALDWFEALVQRRLDQARWRKIVAGREEKVRDAIISTGEEDALSGLLEEVCAARAEATKPADNR